MRWTLSIDAKMRQTLLTRMYYVRMPDFPVIVKKGLFSIRIFFPESFQFYSGGPLGLKWFFESVKKYCEVKNKKNSLLFKKRSLFFVPTANI